MRGLTRYQIILFLKHTLDFAHLDSVTLHWTRKHLVLLGLNREMNATRADKGSQYLSGPYGVAQDNPRDVHDSSDAPLDCIARPLSLERDQPNKPLPNVNGHSMKDEPARHSYQGTSTSYTQSDQYSYRHKDRHTSVSQFS